MCILSFESRLSSSKSLYEKS